MPRNLSTCASAALLLALACDRTTGGTSEAPVPNDPEQPEVNHPHASPTPLTPPPTATTPTWRKHPPVPGKPAGYEAPLSDAVTQTVRSALEQGVGVPVTVRASLDLRDVSPDLGVWLVYDYNPYQQCLLTRPQESCFEEFGDGEWDVDRPRDRILGCTRQWLARAKLGDNRVELTTRIALNGSCVLEDVRHFELLDLDADQQFEIYLDISGRRNIDGFEENTTQEAVSRVVKVLRPDGAIQYEWHMSESIQDSSWSVAKRFEFVDHNGDGHLDLEFEKTEYLGALGADFEFWPLPVEAGEDESDVGKITQSTYLYDPKLDTWSR